MNDQIDLFNILMRYREMISLIEMQRRTLGRTEYITTYKFKSIDDIAEVMAALKDALDSASQILSDLQGDVAIQNYMSSIVHLKSVAMCLESDGKETRGDARDIVDVKRLDELVALLGASIAYYNANLSQAKMFDIIHTVLAQMDCALSSIVQSTYKALGCSPDSVGFLTSWDVSESCILFTILDNKKYFTPEEQAEIDEQERIKREAIEKAEAEAKRAQELVEANADMVLLIKDAGGLDWTWSGDEAEVVSDAVKAIKHIAGDTAEVMKNLDGIRTSTCISFVTKDEPIATKVFVNFAKFMSWIAGKKVIVYDTDAYSNIENMSYGTLPPGMLAHLEEEL
jgi:hypothetical protein